MPIVQPSSSAPSPEEKALESKGFLSSAFDAVVDTGIAGFEAFGHAMDWLDTPDRYARTLLATAGDFDKASEAWDNPETLGESGTRVGSGRDILNATGLGFMEFGSERGVAEWADIPDFVTETIAEIITSPTSYLGVGVLSKVGKAVGIAGKTALTGFRAGGAAKAAATTRFMDDFLKATGKAISKSDAEKRILAGGRAATLGERLRSGESGLSLGLPFQENNRLFLTPVNKALAPVADLIGEVADVVGPGVTGVVRAAPGGSTFLKGLNLTKNFFTNKTGQEVLDIIGETQQSPLEILSPLMKPAVEQYEKLRKMGVKDDMLEYVTRFVEATAPAEHMAALAKATGQSIPELKDLAKQAGRVDSADLVKELIEKGATPEQLDEIQKTAHMTTDIYQRIWEAEVTAGAQVSNLSGKLLEKVGKKKADFERAEIKFKEINADIDDLIGEQVAKADAAAKNAPPIPIGAARPPVVDTALRGMDEGDLIRSRSAAEVDLQRLQAELDANPALMKDNSFRKVIAEAQDKFSSLSNESFFKAAEKMDLRELIARVRNLDLDTPDDKIKALILADVVREKGAGFRFTNARKEEEFKGILAKLSKIKAGIKEQVQKVAKADAQAPGPTRISIPKTKQDILDSAAKALELSKKELDEAVQNAALLPGYSPHALTDEAVEVLLAAERKAPGMHRKMTDAAGRPMTADEVNKLVQELGTAATAGRAVKGKVSLTDVMKLYRDPNVKGLTGTAAALQKAMKTSGKYHSLNPSVLLADRAQSAAYTISSANYVRDIKNVYGLTDEAAREAVMKAAASPEEAKALLAMLREGQAPPGFVRASNLEGLAEKLPRLPNGKPNPKADFLLPSHIAVAVHKQSQALRNPEVLKGILAPVRDMTRILKMLNVANPGFYIRNEMGTHFQAMQGGAFNPFNPLSVVAWSKAQAEAFKIGWAMRKGAADPSKALSEMTIDLGNGRSINGSKFMHKLARMGAVDSGYFGVEFSDLSAASKPRKGLKGLSERLAHANQFIENKGKVAFVLSRMRQGDDMLTATLGAQKHMFNYRNVSPAVNMLRSYGVAPFVAWQAKNIPLQLELFAKRPGDYLALMHAKDVLESGMPGMTQEESERYITRWGVRIKKLPGGGYEFITVEGIIPAVDLMGFTQAFQNKEAFGDYISQLLGEPYKGTLEALFNRKLFTNQEITKANEMGMLKLFPKIGDYFGGVNIKVPGFVANMAKGMAGRFGQSTGSALDYLADLVPGSNNRGIDKDTGEPADFMHSPFATALLPMAGKRVATPNDIRIQIKSIDRDIGDMRGVIKKARTENPWIVGDHLKRLQELISLKGRLMKEAGKHIPVP